jgi:hypothetical protein
MNPLLQRAIKAFASNPAAKAGGLLMGGTMAAELIGEPVVSGFQQALAQPAAVDAGIALEQEENARMERDALRLRRLRESIRINHERLKQVAPDLYTQLVYQRELPRGAIMIGGQPSFDLVNRVAAMMGDGAFRNEV